MTKQSGVTAQSNDPAHVRSADAVSGNLSRAFADPRPRILPGDAFKLFMVAYMSFRLLCDFIKPYPRLFLGLGGIQWACVLILLYYSPDVLRWLGLRPAH